MLPAVAFLGGSEILIIFILILVIVAAKRLPEIGKSVGQSIRAFNEEAGAPPARSAPTAEVEGDESEGSADGAEEAPARKPIEVEVMGRVVREVPVVRRVAQLKDTLARFGGGGGDPPPDKS